jgi:glycosyltransferase involved in cell wall biosynthesis
VDTELFSPEKRSKVVRASWRAEEKTVLLYVGRVSWEKNLRCLARAYLEIWKRRRDVHLVVTGDGPARMELEGMFLDAKANVTFTGYLEGQIRLLISGTSSPYFPSSHRFHAPPLLGYLTPLHSP